MAKGRKKIPDALKLIKGTLQPCRSAKTAETQDATQMVPPDSISETAKRHFETLRERIAILGIDSATYSEALALAAMRMEEIDACNDDIAAHGRVIMSETDRSGAPILRANPAVTMRNEAMRHLQSLLAEFGLTPSSIGRVGGKKKEPEKQQGFGGL